MSSAASTPSSHSHRRSGVQREEWSTHSDTESYVSNSELDASMPSHMYREFRGLPSNNVLKQNMKRTLKEKRPKSRGRLDQTDGAFSVDNDAVVSNEEEVFRGMNLSPDDYADFMGRQKDIKQMPTSIRRKRTIK